MYCHCGLKFTFGEVGDGPPNVPWAAGKRVQFCGTCGNPHHVVQEERSVRYGPLDGRHPQNYVGHADGTASTFWWTYSTAGKKLETVEYLPYPFTKVNGMDQGRNHLMKFWHALDECIDQIRGDQTDTALIEAEKVRAKTYAEVLAQLMHMFYADANAVLAESMVRWKARQDGTEHQSPGLAEHIWDPTRAYELPPGVNTSPTANPAVKFDDQKLTFIKHCLANGTQTPEVLAGMFSCTVDDIKAAVDA